MSLPTVATPDEWCAARVALLAEEKALTRQRDALNAKRRELPMVPVEEDYASAGPQGTATLLDLFEGRPQLIVYHFMFHPEWDEGCSSCTAGTDELSAGFLEHLHRRDTSYAMVSRAPLAKRERWKARRGWDVPWYSSGGTTFNEDFGVTIDESRSFDTYNYRTLDDGRGFGPTRVESSPAVTIRRSSSAPSTPRRRPCGSTRTTSSSPPPAASTPPPSASTPPSTSTPSRRPPRRHTDGSPHQLRSP